MQELVFDIIPVNPRFQDFAHFFWVFDKIGIIAHIIMNIFQILIRERENNEIKVLISGHGIIFGFVKITFQSTPSVGILLQIQKVAFFILNCI